MSIIIDPELKNLLPPITSDEKRLLKESLQNDGQLDPVIIWKQKKILVDGHNRYELMRELGLGHPRTKAISFSTKDEVRKWVLNHQLGKRNLSDHDKAMMTKKLVDMHMTNKGKKQAISEVAKATAQSESTVKRHNEYGEVLKMLIPAWQEYVRELKLSRKRVKDIAKETPEFQKKCLEEVLNKGPEILDKIFSNTSKKKPDHRRIPMDERVKIDERKVAEAAKRSPPPPEGATKEQRVEHHLTCCEKSCGELSRHIHDLFGKNGLARGGTVWEHKISAAIRTISYTLEEVRNSA